jgi:hypothetical protein
MFLQARRSRPIRLRLFNNSAQVIPSISNCKNCLTFLNKKISGYPSFAPTNDACLNVYPPTANIKPDPLTNDALTRSYPPPQMDTVPGLVPPATSTFTNKCNIKREPGARELSASPSIDMVCMWETDSSGGICGRQFLDQRKFVDHLNNEHVGALDGKLTITCN